MNIFEPDLDESVQDEGTYLWRKACSLLWNTEWPRPGRNSTVSIGRALSCEKVTSLIMAFAEVAVAVP